MADFNAHKYNNLKQYNGKAWDADTTEETYRREVFRRAACVFLNILAPEHLEERFSGDSPAQLEEIMRSSNDIWDRLSTTQREEIRLLVGELTKLKDGEWTDAQLMREWRKRQDAGCHE